MAVRFDAVADRLIRTANVVNYNSAYTICLWVYLVSDRNAWGDIASVSDGTTSNYDSVGVTGAGTTLTWGVAFAGDQTGPELPVGQWCHIALVRSSATSLVAYKDGVIGGVPHAANVAARAASSRMEVGGTDGGTEWMDMRVAAVKIYSAALTAAEILKERETYAPVRTSNLVLYTPLVSASDVTDQSGNGYDWTVGGTLGTEGGPVYGSTTATASNAATGTALLAITGTGSTVAAAPANAATASEVFTGTGSSVAAAPASASTGSVGGPVSGTAATVATAATSSSALEIFTGTAVTAAGGLVPSDEAGAWGEGAWGEGAWGEAGGPPVYRSLPTSELFGLLVFASTGGTVAPAPSSASAGQVGFGSGTAATVATASTAAIGSEVFSAVGSTVATAASAATATELFTGTATTAAVASNAALGNAEQPSGSVVSTAPAPTTAATGEVTQPAITGTVAVTATAASESTGALVIGGTADAIGIADTAASGSLVHVGICSTVATANSLASAPGLIVGTAATIASASTLIVGVVPILYLDQPGRVTLSVTQAGGIELSVVPIGTVTTEIE